MSDEHEMEVKKMHGYKKCKKEVKPKWYEKVISHYAIKKCCKKLNQNSKFVELIET